MNFENLGLDERIVKALTQMGIVEPTEIQARAIPLIKEGKDIIGKSKTGTGKTLAFVAPMIEKIDSTDNIQCLILCPTRELVGQIDKEVKKFTTFYDSIKSTSIYGGESIQLQISRLRRKPQIIMATPGRLIDHLKRKTIKLDHVHTVVLDEADEIISVGFKDELEKILGYLNSDRQTLFFSATLPKKVAEIADAYLQNPIEVEVKSPQETVDNIKEYYIECRNKDKDELLRRLLILHNHEKGIIFCNTKRKVDELTTFLRRNRISCGAIHGDFSQNIRERTMNSFKNEELNILIATDVAARGIDVKGIEYVYNYDIPRDIEYYIHRIGRTGRAGKDGVSYSLVTRTDYQALKRIEKITNCKIEKAPVPTPALLEESVFNNYMEKLEKKILNRRKRSEVLKNYGTLLIEKNYSLEEIVNVLIDEKVSVIDFEKIHDLEAFANGGTATYRNQSRNRTGGNGGGKRTYGGTSSYKGKRNNSSKNASNGPARSKDNTKRKFGKDNKS